MYFLGIKVSKGNKIMVDFAKAIQFIFFEIGHCSVDLVDILSTETKLRSRAFDNHFCIVKNSIWLMLFPKYLDLFIDWVWGSVPGIIA